MKGPYGMSWIWRLRGRPFMHLDNGHPYLSQGTGESIKSEFSLFHVCTCVRGMWHPAGNLWVSIYLSAESGLPTETPAGKSHQFFIDEIGGMGSWLENTGGGDRNWVLHVWHKTLQSTCFHAYSTFISCKILPLMTIQWHIINSIIS